MPPRNAMSLPARMPTHLVAIADVRVKRGSMWMTVRAPLARLHHPLEADRVVLGHVRAHDHDAVGVLEVLLEVRRAASSERGPQTGDRGAVSYAGLVLDLHDAERRHQLLDQVVLFVVERRAAEVADRHRAIRRVALLRLRPPSSRRASSTIRCAIMSIAVLEVEAPPTRVPYGRRYLTLYSRSGLCT